MNRKKYKLSTREKVLLTITMLIAGIAGIAIFVYFPMMDTLEQLEEDLRRARDVQHEMRMLDIRLEYLRNSVSTLDEFIEETLAMFEARGNNEDLDHDFASFLTNNQVKVLELTIQDMEPLSEVERSTGYLSRQVVDIRVHGDLHDQIKFLDYVSGFWSFRIINYNFDNDPELPEGNYSAELFFSYR
ncbi:MAG: hypothetical protein FWE27_03770 [Defluviitaleaceae bacterium]|nr:hypothetical protein [Defluviitaleaceae bacterium]